MGFALSSFSCRFRCIHARLGTLYQHSCQRPRHVPGSGLTHALSGSTERGGRPRPRVYVWQQILRAAALNVGCQDGGGARVVEPQVGLGVNGALAAEGKLLGGEQLLAAQRRRERVCQLLLSLRPVERENEHPLDELVVERRRVELAHAAERFGRVRRGEVLANHVGDVLLERLDGDVGRSAEDVAPPVAKVRGGEQRARLRQRAALLLALKRVGRKRAHKRGRDEVVGRGAHEERGQVRRRRR
mmetsp:Transcript_27663/g.58212  ORF Transcript_27663/g.58212 Transcript_27663/m.58212 type:complete len:244 (+) Transcript_27663:75-806(+)